MDPSSPTLKWPRRPALELTEQKRRETRVVTLRAREKGGLQKVGHTTMAQPNILARVFHLIVNKLIHFKGYPKTYPMVVHMPKVSQ